MVSGIAPVIVKGAEDTLSMIFRWRDIVSQVRVTIQRVAISMCCFLLGMVVKLLPVKGQMGVFKPLITLSNLVLSIALVCCSVQVLNNLVRKFTLLTRRCE